MSEIIAKIESTHLGYEDHGIFTAYLNVNYGGSAQGIGGYGLDQWDAEAERRIGTSNGMEFIIGVLAACGVSRWEDVKGRTIMVIRDGDGWNARVVGIKPLPTERGREFLFQSAFPTEVSA